MDVVKEVLEPFTEQAIEAARKGYQDMVAKHPDKRVCDALPKTYDELPPDLQEAWLDAALAGFSALMQTLAEYDALPTKPGEALETVGEAA
jgi:hypothetical protein